MLIYQELKNQGRKQRWLKAELEKRGVEVSYSSLSNIVRGRVKNPHSRKNKDVLKEIALILNIELQDI